MDQYVMKLTRSSLLVLGMLVCSGIPSEAEDLAVTLIQAPKTVPLGAPVILSADIRNLSGTALTIAFGHTNGMLMRYDIRDAQGSPARGPDVVSPDTTQRYTLKEVPPGWRDVRSEVFWPDVVGTWTVRFVAESRGPYVVANDLGGPRALKAWTGTAASPEVRIEIVAPSAGVDKEAYDAFDGKPMGKPGALLRKFPTSTYAAYAVYLTMYGFVGSAPRDVLDATEQYTKNGYGLWASVPDEETGTESGLSGTKLIQWYDRWIGSVLGSHPDIWFADALRLKRAVNLVADTKKNLAESEMQNLAQRSGYAGEQAKEYLALMRKGGGGRPVEGPNTKLSR